MTVVTDDLIQARIVAALTGATAAGANVYTPRTWPTKATAMPFLMVQSPTEEKVSLGRSGPAQFHVTATFRVVGRVYALETGVEQAAQAALAAVGALKRQVEIAVINDGLLHQMVQKFASVRSITDVKTEGEATFGELVMDFGIEFYQGPEDFAPVEADPIEELAIYADLLNVFSPTGVFADTPFADDATAPPRTSGPDGRPEGAALIPLPQP